MSILPRGKWLFRAVAAIKDRFIMGKLQPSGTSGNPTIPVQPLKPSQPVAEPEPWTACDRCGFSKTDGQPIARAAWRVYLHRGSLFFCGHCLTELTPIILECGYYYRRMAYAYAV